LTPQILKPGYGTGYAARQWLLIAVSHVVSYCVERTMSEKEALVRQ